MIAYGFKKFHQNENRFFHSNQLLNQRTPPHIPLIYIFKSKLIFSQATLYFYGYSPYWALLNFLKVPYFPIRR